MQGTMLNSSKEQLLICCAQHHCRIGNCDATAYVNCRGGCPPFRIGGGKGRAASCLSDSPSGSYASLSMVLCSSHVTMSATILHSSSQQATVADIPRLD
jgi:hypothetical protein